MIGYKSMGSEVRNLGTMTMDPKSLKPTEPMLFALNPQVEPKYQPEIAPVGNAAYLNSKPTENDSVHDFGNLAKPFGEFSPLAQVQAGEVDNGFLIGDVPVEEIQRNSLPLQQAREESANAFAIIEQNLKVSAALIDPVYFVQVEERIQAIKQVELLRKGGTLLAISRLLWKVTKVAMDNPILKFTDIPLPRFRGNDNSTGGVAIIPYALHLVFLSLAEIRMGSESFSKIDEMTSIY